MNEPTEIPDPGSYREWDEEWEIDYESIPHYRGTAHYTEWDTGPYFELYPVFGWKRRHFEEWTEGGKLVGRYRWERKGPI